ncbi:MAG: RDD family protein [Armatimonadetes bacterium]|nr:RDD family protein [Akkermansiaceae bacterium]
MEIWLIRNGEKSGPYPDYEIRSRIEHEELESDAKVWHDGLTEWTEIGKLDLFRDEFGKKSEAPQPPPLPKAVVERGASAVVEAKPKRYLARRFWARWLDLTTYAAVWWLAMYLAGRDIGAAIQNPWMLLPMYLPWFALESWAIHRFGRTFGKWLMGLRVENDDGSMLSLKAAVWRSVRVMVTGIGFGWGLLSLLCQGMSWFTTKRIGKPIWDYLGKHKVTAEPASPFKIGAMVMLFIGAAQLQMAVRGPHEEKIMIEAFPQYKEFFQRGNGWYFPVKNSPKPAIFES